MSFNTRDLIDAGRGHLIPDFDLWDIYGDDDDWHEYICEEQEARIDAGDGDE